MALKDVQNFFHHLCFARSCDSSAAGLEKFLPPQMVQHLMQYPSHRRTLYRRLVRANITSVFPRAMPILWALLTKDEQEELVADFLADYRPRTPYFRRIPENMLTYLQSSPPPLAQRIPWLVALADYECVQYNLTFAEEISPMPSHPEKTLKLARPIFNPHLHRRSYGFPVHTWSRDTRRETIVPTPIDLVIVRHPETLAIQSVELTKQGLEILAGLQGCQNLAAGAEELIQKYAKISLEEILAFLQKLTQQKIVLGFV